MANETMQWPSPGLGSVGSYQMGGIPYATASLAVPANTSNPINIQFPYVTKFATISCDSGSIRVGFSNAGVSGSGTNYFVLTEGDTYTGEWRIEDLFILSTTTSPASASIVAGLTPIPRGIPALGAANGNNWSGSAGVG